MDSIKDSFDNAKVVWVDPSEAGLEFIRTYDKDPSFYFTTRSRPDKFAVYFPEQAKLHNPKAEV